MKLVFLAVILFLFVSCGYSSNDGGVIKKCERKIDLSSQIVKHVYKITFENPSPSAVNNFIFSLTDEEKESHATFITKVS